MENISANTIGLYTRSRFQKGVIITSIFSGTVGDRILQRNEIQPKNIAIVISQGECS